MNLRLGLRAGLLLGLLRTIWMAVEHLLGVRTEHLEWVEPSYGTFLLVGTPRSSGLFFGVNVGRRPTCPRSV